MVRLLPWMVVVLAVGSVLMERPAHGQTAKPLAAAQEKTPTPEERIKKALREPTTFDFVETPLSDVAAYICKTHGIEVQLDKKAMDDLGVSTDTPITKSVKGISLRSALTLVLRELDLTSVIKDEVLLITTQETADSMLITETYDVTDLAAYRDEKDEIWYECEPLIDVISSVLVPTSWDSVGGPGCVNQMVVGETAILVVNHTEAVHEQIVNLLTKMRQEVRKRGDKQTPPRRDRPRSAAEGAKLAPPANARPGIF